jgi:hypothetical protein
VSLTGVVTDFDPIEPRQCRLHFEMHCFDRLTALFSTSYVRLVGNYNQQEICCFQACAPGNYVIVKFESFNGRWRERAPTSDDWPIKHSIAIKKDRASR